MIDWKKDQENGRKFLYFDLERWGEGGYESSFLPIFELLDLPMLKEMKELSKTNPKLFYLRLRREDKCLEAWMPEIIEQNGESVSHLGDPAWLMSQQLISVYNKPDRDYNHRFFLREYDFSKIEEYHKKIMNTSQMKKLTAHYNFWENM